MIRALFLIAGLGNPGKRYEATRHNAGFMLVDRLAQELGASFDNAGFEALWCRAKGFGEDLILVKPQMYMNLSGVSVAGLARFYKIDPGAIIVCYDDCDLPTGRVRVRPSGGSGGHRGVASIIEKLGATEFPRIRLGVGRPEKGRGDVADYVLSPFDKEEMDTVEAMLGKACEAVGTIVQDGVESAMNRHNAA